MKQVKMEINPTFGGVEIVHKQVIYDGDAIEASVAQAQMAGKTIIAGPRVIITKY